MKPAMQIVPISCRFWLSCLLSLLALLALSGYRPAAFVSSMIHLVTMRIGLLVPSFIIRWTLLFLSFFCSFIQLLFPGVLLFVFFCAPHLVPFFHL